LSELRRDEAHAQGLPELRILRWALDYHSEEITLPELNGISPDTITIALDGMGCDNAPVNDVAGAVKTVNETDKINIVLVGKKNKIDAELKKHSYDPKRITIFHADEVIEMHESPTDAVKKKPESSIIIGLRLVRESKADAFISAGNTGAVMAASLLTLGRIANVTRPTIGESFPTDKGVSIVFDVGANMDCKPVHLLEFAVMGVVYANHIFGIENPRVALLNVGEEKSKGNMLTYDTYQLLESSGLNFIGNVEGRDVLHGKAEVIVCDGYTGNVILKFAESVPAVLRRKFINYANKNLFNKIWVGMMYKTLKKILKDFDYQQYGGVPLLGVNGVTIIGHGSSSPLAIKNMCLKAELMIKEKICDVILEKIKDIKAFVPKAEQ
jgi:glycerol-3-phosphate acyltransferase PlsX